MSANSLRIALAQTNPVVGAIADNATRVLDLALHTHRELNASIVVFPELMLSGYPPEDLLLRPGLMAAVKHELDELIQQLAQQAPGLAVILGTPMSTTDRDNDQPQRLRNSALVLRDGKILARCDKQRLPNYGVFDEQRYFDPGTGACVVELNGARLGITICEDAWDPAPMQAAREAGAEALINLNASPFERNKAGHRQQTMRQRVAENTLPLFYVNLVGGQDELVFDGGSFVMDAGGTIRQQAAMFEEDMLCTTLLVDDPGNQDGTKIDAVGANHNPRDTAPANADDPLRAIYQALVLGTRDYVRKNGFTGALLGLSGGIDSALTLAIAVDALGAANVEAVMMPSRYTAGMSVDDAGEQARSMGVHYQVIPIEQPVTAFNDILAPAFEGLAMDATEENIQARCRGVILMALSNKSGRMLLTTGNKSEMSVGYATLYGDMAGGYAPIKDCPKQLVYELARWRNQSEVIIPQRVIDRPPSAELRPDQQDSDSLPEYDILDPILERFIEHDQSAAQIIAAGFDAETVERITGLVLRNEYKRRQAPPGVKISARAFGRDRRYPIASGYGRGEHRFR